MKQTRIAKRLGLSLITLGVSLSMAMAANVAYIHGDVADNGTVPSGSAAPFHQMLLTDAGNRGLSQYAAMVRAEGHTIGQYYDANTNMTRGFLDQFDVVVFGLHQKIWSSTEKTALDGWLRDGGSMMIYSDSASGGLFSIVGIGNPVGQNATNNIIRQYGMEVTVDIGAGTRSYRPQTSSNPIVQGNPVLEGEGISPVAVAPNSGVQILYPLSNSFKVAGGNLNNAQITRSGLTISNPTFACLALQEVGSGKVLVQFDRQPMWNNGEGSSINRRDNKEIQRRIINFLSANAGNGGTVNSLDCSTLPSTVTNGTSISVGIGYEASASRDIYLEVRRVSDNQWITAKTTTVSAGASTLNVTLNIGTQADGDYKFTTSMYNVGENWTNGSPYDSCNSIPFTLGSSGGGGGAIGSTIVGSTYSAESNPTDDNNIRAIGNVVGYVRPDNWIRYDGFDFGSGAGSVSVTASTGSINQGGNIEFRLGSPTGTLISTVNVTGTAGWNTYQPFTSSVTGATGSQNLYLVFKAVAGSAFYLLNVQDFTFSAGGGSGGGSVNATPSDDARLQHVGTGPYYNNNGATLQVENWGRIRESFLKFNVTGVTGTASGSQLRLVSTAAGSGTINVYLGGSNSWTEANLAQANAPSQGALLGSLTGTFTAGSVHTIDLSGITGNGTVSLILKRNNGAGTLEFSSSEGANPPRLTVDFQ